MEPIPMLDIARNILRSVAAGLVLPLAIGGWGTLPSARAQWTVINLHPTGTLLSRSLGVGGSQQVGYALVGPTVGDSRASLWSGTAASWVNLHPGATGYSLANDADGGQQVGEFFPAGSGRAALWTGSAASWVDLHPAGQLRSSAFGAGDGQQVGRTDSGGSQAALWRGTAASWVNLNPPPTNGYNHSSEAYAAQGGQQVGYVVAVGGVYSASLWSGSAASWVNLHPVGAAGSTALGIGDGSQVGWVIPVQGGVIRAAMWSGTAASWVDLHPPGVFSSFAVDIAVGRQVGWVAMNGSTHASLWSGTAASWVDLHSFLPAAFTSSQAKSITTDGTLIIVGGHGFNSATRRDEAVLWTMPLPPPACPPDFNGDGFLDFFDYDDYVNCFETGTCAAGVTADFNGDGFVDFFDYDDYVAAFEAGC